MMNTIPFAFADALTTTSRMTTASASPFTFGGTSGGFRFDAASPSATTAATHITPRSFSFGATAPPVQPTPFSFGTRVTARVAPTSTNFLPVTASTTTSSSVNNTLSNLLSQPITTRSSPIIMTTSGTPIFPLSSITKQQQLPDLYRMGNTHQCVFNEECDITVNSRGACRYCRFKKCLSVGLDKDLVRGPYSHQDRARKKRKQKKSTDISDEKTLSLPVVIPTRNLLNNDRSLLTTNQWGLLSNVIHAYDDKSPVSTIRSTMTLQAAYPVKMRFKMAMDCFKHMTGSMYLSAGPFIKTMPEFVNMSIDDQGVLVERNIRSMSGVSGILVMREADVCTNPYYHNASVAIYGHQRIHQAMRIIAQTDNDGTLIKLMIPILALSTCSDILDTVVDDMTNITATPGGTRFFSNTLSLLKAQNIYVEMMFKYMLYRYGYNEASLRFSNLIKNCLDQNLMLTGDGDLRKHQQMVQEITEETERSLTLHDEPIE
ncbi:unnamed protein product [Rotaria sordida]|uniref:Nuclear receptor domain-containing protein n=1 Tax=Rotaria sordida TaxID=392033 RepID=A0A814PKS5_9BILA|nr:unnamed protein product [Rotaria sordida]CAF1316727.1 unnamed protein product [Rotaria sordida]